MIQIVNIIETADRFRLSCPERLFCGHLADSSNITTGARLAEGSYLAVQISETMQTTWDWSEWVYHPTSGQVVNKAEPKQLIPFNYLSFGVSRYQERLQT